MFVSLHSRHGKNKITLANHHHVVASSHRPPSVSPHLNHAQRHYGCPPPPVFSSVLSQANQSHIDGRAPSLARLRVTHHLKRRTGDDQSENLIPSLAPAEPTHRRARTHAAVARTMLGCVPPSRCGSQIATRCMHMGNDLTLFFVFFWLLFTQSTNFQSSVVKLIIPAAKNMGQPKQKLSCTQGCPPRTTINQM